jgi:glutathione S-transferase
MLKLHGFPVSNYSNMVHLALLEKGVPFEYVLTIPDQSPAVLARSPRGKVPFIETPQGFLNETSAILDYLEERGEGRPLLPADPFARAQVRALMREIELYIELPARTCYGEAFFGATLPDAIKARAREDLKAGFATLGRHGSFAPYVAGSEFTLADVVFLYSAVIANVVTQKLFGLDLLGAIPGATELVQRLNENPNVQVIARNHDAAMPGFIAAMQAKAKAAK